MHQDGNGADLVAEKEATLAAQEAEERMEYQRDGIPSRSVAWAPQIPKYTPPARMPPRLARSKIKAHRQRRRA